MGNCLWRHFMLLFTSLAFRKCKTVFNILKIILVLGFCPRKTKLLDPLSDFVLISFSLEKISCISPSCKLVPVQYREDRSQKPLSMRTQFPPSNVSIWRTTNKISRVIQPFIRLLIHLFKLP